MARLAKLIPIISALGMVCSHAGPLADKAAAADSKRESYVEGSDGWRFLPAELRFADKLASPDISALAAPAVTVIADFASQLREGGVSLVVVPIPPKALVQSSSLGLTAEEQLAMKSGWEKIMADLGGRGVQAIDFLTDYTAATEPVFCLRDTHWSGRGIDVAVQRLLAALPGAGIAVDAASEGAQAPLKDMEINGDLGGSPEKVQLRFPAVPDSSNAPQLLLLGDSHVLVFHQGGDLHGTGAGLPEQLASVLGFMPSVLGVRGSGATSSRLQLARKLRSEPDYLAGKKLVVWVFAGREFTEADMWKKIPIFPAGKKVETGG